MISVATAKVQEEQLSQHDSYVSAICTLNVDPTLRYACSISYDCFKVWNCTDEQMVNLITVPLNFTNEGNYRWWDICEIKQSLSNLTAQEKVIVGCSSSKDSQTRVYRLNLISQEHNVPPFLITFLVALQAQVDFPPKVYVLSVLTPLPSWNSDLGGPH